MHSSKRMMLITHNGLGIFNIWAIVQPSATHTELGYSVPQSSSILLACSKIFWCKNRKRVPGYQISHKKSITSLYPGVLFEKPPPQETPDIYYQWNIFLFYFHSSPSKSCVEMAVPMHLLIWCLPMFSTLSFWKSCE